MWIQLYCEMIPLPLLHKPPFVGDAPLIGAMRDHARELVAETRHRAWGSQANIELVLRVTMHDDVDRTLNVVEDLIRHPARWGVDRLRLWPQLPDEDGVYLSGATLEPFFARLHQILDGMERRNLTLPALLFDVEPRMEVLESLLVTRRKLGRTAAGVLGRAFGMGARQEHVALASTLHRAVDAVRQRYTTTHPELLTASVFPAMTGKLRLLLERLLAVPTVEPASGAPIFDALEAMAYGSLVGYAVPQQMDEMRRVAGTTYMTTLARHHRRWCAQNGMGAGLLLGCTGIGLLGNEPVFESAHELATHARAANIHNWSRIGVYNLRGLLAEGEQALGSRDWRPWITALLGR